jgi:hypothetical protein
VQKYNFGESITLKRKAFKARIQELFDEIKEHQPAFLVFHDNNQDIKWAFSVSVVLQNYNSSLDTSTNLK